MQVYIQFGSGEGPFLTVRADKVKKTKTPANRKIGGDGTTAATPISLLYDGYWYRVRMAFHGLGRAEHYVVIRGEKTEVTVTK